jgi:DNA repair photolyase
MGPVVPFLSDSPAQLDAAVSQIAAAGATHVMPIVLHLRPGTREWYFRWLGANHPGLVGRYLDLYGRSAYAPKSYQAKIAGQVRELADKHGIGRPRPGFGHGRRLVPERPTAQALDAPAQALEAPAQALEAPAEASRAPAAPLSPASEQLTLL